MGNVENTILSLELWFTVDLPKWSALPGEISIQPPNFSPKLVISIQFDPCNQGIFELRTAMVSLIELF
jgi:hypothetical protein